MDFTKWYSKYCIDSRLKYPSIKTQENYQSSVGGFLKCFINEIDPQHIKTDKIKQWLLTFESTSTRNHKLCAVKSFYEITVGMPIKLDSIPFSRKAQKLPMPLDIDEIGKLIDACENKKHLAIISLLFGCGMRVGEVINLKPEQIDRSRMVIHVINGKGAKDRFVPLDEIILKTLKNTTVNTDLNLGCLMVNPLHQKTQNNTRKQASTNF